MDTIAELKSSDVPVLNEITENTNRLDADVKDVNGEVTVVAEDSAACEDKETQNDTFSAPNDTICSQPPDMISVDKDNTEALSSNAVTSYPDEISPQVVVPPLNVVPITYENTNDQSPMRNISGLPSNRPLDSFHTSSFISTSRSALYPNLQPSIIRTHSGAQVKIMHFDPPAYGYQQSNDEFSFPDDPRKGYPLIYPYIPIPFQAKKKERKRNMCC